MPNVPDIHQIEDFLPNLKKMRFYSTLEIAEAMVGEVPTYQKPIFQASMSKRLRRLSEQKKVDLWVETDGGRRILLWRVTA